MRIGLSLVGAQQRILSSLAAANAAAALSTLRLAVDEAIAELTITQGQVAAFNGVTVDSSAAILDDLDIGLATAPDNLGGVNEAQETADLARAQLLASNALAALAILQQQQASSLILIQQLAGQK